MPQICRVCSHEKRVEIERLLIKGEMSKLAIARRFQVSKDSIYSHLKNHLTDRLARTEQIMSAEATNVMSELNSVTFMLKAALSRAEKVKDDRGITESAKVLLKSLELLSKIEFQLHAQRIKAVDPDELERFRVWEAENDQSFREALALSQEDKEIIDAICFEKLRRMSGASDRESFVSNSKIYRQYGTPLEQLNFDSEPKPKHLSDRIPQESDRNTASNAVETQGPDQDIKGPGKDQDKGTEKPLSVKPVEPDQLQHTDLTRAQLLDLKRNVKFGAE